MHSSAIEAAKDGGVPQAEPLAASRRWAVIGALAVAAVWIVASDGPFGRLQTPLVPGGAQTGPTVMGSFYPQQVGASVLPPEGASQSAPERGKLVAAKEDIYVFADGRMIWGREGLSVWLEQRLTPEGVELMRSGVVRLDGQSLDPGSALPEGALGHRLIKAYVPSRFAVCPGYWPWDTESLQPSSFLAHLPVPAQALLRGSERTYGASGRVTGGNPSPPFTCFEVTTEEARALDGMFRDAGIERIYELDDSTPSQWVVYEATAAIRRSFISMMPLLPHGEWGFSGGG